MLVVMQTVDTMKRNITAIYENLNQLLKNMDGSSYKKTPKAKMRRPRATTIGSALANSQENETSLTC